MASYNIDAIRADFPILSRKVNNKPLVYLDNGASAQKPKAVIDAVQNAYSFEYANVHRGLHYLSNTATTHYEAVRGKIQRFLNAEHENEIIFTTGATMAFNMIASGWGAEKLSKGDEVLLSTMEHHANIVPWHFHREQSGIVLNFVDPDADGSLPAQKVIDAITPNTKVIALTHMSNVLGTQVDIAAICKIAREKGILTVIDGSQSSVHMPIDVQALGCDAFVITGHKLYGPTASGAVYIRQEVMDQMRPFFGGGDMINTVTKEQVTYNTAPHKFEAGTPGIVQMIGLGAAIDYLQDIGMANIAAHEASLRDYAYDKLRNLNWLEIQGTTSNKGAIFSFTLAGHGHPHDISTILDQRGIAVRAGHHCAQPLMQHLGVTATTRASFGLYNTLDEVDALVSGLELCYEMLA